MQGWSLSGCEILLLNMLPPHILWPVVPQKSTPAVLLAHSTVLGAHHPFTESILEHFLMLPAIQLLGWHANSAVHTAMPLATQRAALPLTHGRRMAGDTAVQTTEMTVQSVDHALEEVRPYLMADGGNVTVVDVQHGIVFLRLEVRTPARPGLLLFILCMQADLAREPTQELNAPVWCEGVQITCIPLS